MGDCLSLFTAEEEIFTFQRTISVQTDRDADGDVLDPKGPISHSTHKGRIRSKVLLDLKTHRGDR